MLVTRMLVNLLLQIRLGPERGCTEGRLAQLLPVLPRKHAGQIDAGQQAVWEGVHCQRRQQRPHRHLHQQISIFFCQSVVFESFTPAPVGCCMSAYGRRHYQCAPRSIVWDLADVVGMAKGDIIGEVASELAGHIAQHSARHCHHSDGVGVVLVGGLLLQHQRLICTTPGMCPPPKVLFENACHCDA